jgi:hypothetical protein
MAPLGKLLIICGVILIVAGVFSLFGDKLPFRLGRLPGDINWSSKTGSVRIYFPIMTMLLLSALLTLVVWLLRK